MFAPVAAGDYKAFAQALVQHDRTRHIRNGQEDCFFFIDPLAAAVVVEPAMVTRSLRASLAVVLAPGITRGMTVIDPSGRLETPMVTLVEEVRGDRLAALYAASVAYAPPSRPI
jgi:purine nucleosidase/non-specific riboncleoside hydrolase